jgi:hypothetical protein
MNNDVTLELGHPDKTVIHQFHDEFEWRVTLADTGEKALKGARLKRIEKYTDYVQKIPYARNSVRHKGISQSEGWRNVRALIELNLSSETRSRKANAGDRFTVPQRS